MTQKGVKNDPKRGPFWDPFFGPFFRLKAPEFGVWPNRGSKRGPKKGPKMGQKWPKYGPKRVILGVYTRKRGFLGHFGPFGPLWAVGGQIHVQNQQKMGSK